MIFSFRRQLLFSYAFTLIEALVYILVLAILSAALVSFLIWTLNSNTKIKAQNEVATNGERSLRIITGEIRTSQGIYPSTSVFDNDNGQLSLVTTQGLAAGESIAYHDIYLNNGIIYLKKESSNPVALTNDQVNVNQLKFTLIDASSLEINLGLSYKLATKPQWQTPLTWQAIVGLRQGY